MSLNLIEASAGTGKTWTIAERYALAIAEGLTPQQILVVTYTEAATAELRDRIRKRLVEHGLDEAAHAMDEAAVHTIHGWSLSVLRRYAVRTGVPFDSTVEEEDDTLWRLAAYDWFRTFIYPEDGRPDGWRRHLLNAVESPRALASSTRGKHPVPSPPLDQATGVDYFREIAAVREQLAALGLDDFDNAIAQLRAATENGVFVKGFTDTLVKYLDESPAKTRQWIATGRPAMLDRNTISRLNATKIRASARKTHAGDCPAHEIFDLIDALPQQPDAVHPKAIAVAAQSWVGTRYEAMKTQSRLVGFDDMLRRLREALDADPELAAHLAAEYPVALVDEFQDTDPVQWAIFECIYGAHETASLTLVGDPKQSIYSFRGANLDTYLEATRAVQGERGRLDSNWRSSARLVKAVNRVFTHCRDHAKGPFLRGSDIDFHEVTAVRAHGELYRGDAELAPLTVLFDETEHWRDEAYDRLAASFAGLIARSVTTGPDRLRFVDKDGVAHEAAPEHIAVLVSTRTEAALMRRALAAHGLPSVYLSERDSIFATREASDLALLLDAALEPRNLVRMRAVAASALLAYGLDELETLRADEQALDGFVERIAELGTLWRTSGPLAMVYALAAGFELRARHGTEAERVLTNVLHLGELLQREAAHLDGEHALAGWLHQQVGDAGDARRDGPDVLRLESDSRLVTIVTVHKSKGLEYPLVFIPFASFGHQKLGDDKLEEIQRQFYVAITRARYGCWLGLLPTKSGKLGVSITHHGLAGYALAGGGTIAPGTIRQLLASLRGDCGDITLEAIPEDRGTAKPMAPPALPGRARAYNGESRVPWWVGSFTYLTRTLEAARPTAPQDADDGVVDKAVDEAADDAPPVGTPQPGTLHALRRHADTGTFLHGLLEWAADEGFARIAADAVWRRTEVTRRARFRFDDPGVVDTVADWLGAMLARPLDIGATTPMVHTTLTQFQAELEFWLAARAVSATTIDDWLHTHMLPGQPRPQLGETDLNGMLKGFIDLVFEHEGRWYVADYKSNYLGPDHTAYTQEAMAAQMLKKRYDVQAVLYALALHRQLRARLPGYDYARHFGGAAYIFLRGDAVFHFKPPLELITRLDALFDGRELGDVA